MHLAGLRGQYNARNQGGEDFHLKLINRIDNESIRYIANNNIDPYQICPT